MSLFAIEGGKSEVELLPHEQEMLDIINMVETEQKDQEMGLSLGPRFAQFSDAFNGLRPAFIFLGAQSNVGKTALAIGLSIECVKHNKDVYVIYFALDDRVHEIMPRFISWNQRIPIDAVMFPRKYKDQPNILKRREVGFNELKSLVKKFKIRDINFGDSVEYIEDTVREHKNALPEGTKVVVFIDNFYDLSTRDVSFRDENEKFKHIGKEIDRIANQYSVPIVCTAELRKLNGTRRPIIEDLRETVKLVYKAKAICLCYNEVGLRGEAASIYWDKPGDPTKQPILEVRVGKNKLGSFKGTLFYNFYPDQSYLDEVPPQGRQRLASMID